MIAVVDLGMGNPLSILNMLKKIGTNAVLCHDGVTLKSANGIIFPGVGSFDKCMQSFQDSGLRTVIEKMVFEDKKPFLGICLGMQILLESSEEGTLPGLGWIAGKVVRFKADSSLKKITIPHMGWNVVHPSSNNDLVSMSEEQRFYFVHSYHAADVLPENILATTTYGQNFVSGIHKDNIYGVQFHPEKSHRFGMELMRKFAEKCHA